ncbi:FAD-dependent oxidoreductase [Mucilaginibacter sp. X4EP1]|uniref:FAD-dependent oxidoreductase n=1 Tax=Mucilaginibacter sp. X4EP1 TaxID=2723092 RepID=UPI0021682537|nr:FAD-dependent oxidoreductase [Mucilaginibacter sp. X4EP1]MCS3813983.1 hypothetical protein [Mucilaginibacter sp. X4EP1]
MIKNLFALFLAFNCTFLYAQTVKTDVLVIGNDPGAVSASVQCARSKVKTIWVFEKLAINTTSTPTATYTIENGRNIPSGIWGEFRKLVQQSYYKKPGHDTSQYAALTFEADTAIAVLQKMTDTLKNLSLYKQTTFINIKKDNDYWAVSVRQNEKIITIKTRVVIDATTDGAIALKAGAKFDTAFKNANPNAYRTAIATGSVLPGIENSNITYPPYPFYSIPMNAILLRDLENLLVIDKALPPGDNIQSLPAQLELGQGAGTIAAYCAFFKTTTQNLKVRIIQGELLDYKGYILPFTDINPKDVNWRAIQQVSATGLLNGKLQQTTAPAQFVFMPDSAVLTDEIKPIFSEIYTRAFLWFNNEKPGKMFTIGNTLSFISDYTLTDPQLLQKNIQKAWKSQYKFNTDFDLKQPITRREFAVLANRFLNPFARTIDLNGRLVN